MQLGGILVKILYWHVNKIQESSQSGPVPAKDNNRATISDKERIKESGNFVGGWNEGGFEMIGMEEEHA